MIQLTQNDFGHTIIVNLKDSLGNVINLTSYTVKADIVLPDKTKLSAIALTILDAINGKTQLTVTSAMTAQVGKVKAYIYVTGSGFSINIDSILELNIKIADGGA